MSHPFTLDALSGDLHAMKWWSEFTSSPRVFWPRDGSPSLLRPDPPEDMVLLQASCQDLFLAGRPVNFDAVDFGGIPQTEIEREHTLRKVARLTVIIFGVGLSGRDHSHRGAQSVTVRSSADQHNF